MLGDNPEKSKNPLKKAMRRRNAKTVQFTSPQYFEPTDFEYSEDEEDMEGDPEQVENGIGANAQDNPEGDDIEDDEMELTSTNTQQNGQLSPGTQTLAGHDTYSGSLNSPDKGTASEETSLDDQEDSNVRSRRGLVRNTDSFFKDDGGETKKISLTPRLLRGDIEPSRPVQEPDLKPKSSLETLEKLVSPESDRSGDEKKKKEKKGMLGGFFKRKDKKGKTQDNEAEEVKKVSDEFARSPQQSRKMSDPPLLDAKQGRGDKGPQRQSSRLQKQPPPHMSPKSSPSKDSFQIAERSPHRRIDSAMSPSSPEPSSTPSTLRSPIPEQNRGQEEHSSRVASPDAQQGRGPSAGEKRSMFSPISNAFSPSRVRSPDQGDPTASKAGRAANMQDRFDDDDDDVDSEDVDTPSSGSQQGRAGPPALTTQSAEQRRGRLSESPIEVSPMEPNESHQSSSASQPPTLLVDHSSNSERRSVSPLSPTMSSSPSLVDAETPNDAEESRDSTAPSPPAGAASPSTARSTPTWSDSSLRTYMDNDDDIRDLLIMCTISLM